MATFAANDFLVIVNGVTLSDHAFSLETTDDREQLTATTYGAGAQIFRKGLGTASATIGFFQDFAGGSVYATLQPLISSTTPFQVEVRATSAGRGGDEPGHRDRAGVAVLVRSAVRPGRSDGANVGDVPERRQRRNDLPRRLVGAGDHRQGEDADPDQAEHQAGRSEAATRLVRVVVDLPERHVGEDHGEDRPDPTQPQDAEHQRRHRVTVDAGRCVRVCHEVMLVAAELIDFGNRVSKILDPTVMRRIVMAGGMAGKEAALDTAAIRPRR